ILSFLLPATGMTHVFVYGTLKKGQPNNYRMMDTAKGEAKFLGRARTVNKYPLVIAGEYNIPFLLNIPGEGQRILGDIYSVDDPMLKFLDWFEGCPQMYQRTRVLLEVEEWVGEGEAEDTPKVGSTTEAFLYSTTNYKPEWLQYPTFDSYDAYGDHGLLYLDIMPRSKEIQKQMRKKVIEVYQSGKGYKAISKALGLPRTTVRAIIYKWQKHGTVENLPRSGRPTKITPRAQRQLIQDVTKDPTTTSKELQASLASVKVSVHDSTIRKRLGKNENISMIPKTFGKILCGLTRQKFELFGRSVSHYVWRKSNTAFQKKIITPTVKYGGGSVMVWGCSAASGPGRLAVINGTMNSAVHQKILKENVRPSVCDLKLK
ncbi:hypothetical protein QTP86_019571, partial [Hemibagrus guttatus]